MSKKPGKPLVLATTALTLGDWAKRMAPDFDSWPKWRRENLLSLLKKTNNVLRRMSTANPSNRRNRRSSRLDT